MRAQGEAPGGVFALSVHVWTFWISEYYGQTIQALEHSPKQTLQIETAVKYGVCKKQKIIINGNWDWFYIWIQHSIQTHIFTKTNHLLFY